MGDHFDFNPVGEHLVENEVIGLRNDFPASRHFAALRIHIGMLGEWKHNSFQPFPQLFSGKWIDIGNIINNFGQIFSC